MTDQQLQAIEDRWAKATPGPWAKIDTPDFARITIDGDGRSIMLVQVGSDAIAIASAPTDISLLLAEVRRLRCCGNCRQQVGNPYFECAYMDIESYNESGCKRCSEWEAADNG